ncbi:MAG: hypothetical protein A2X05_18875 [Bacteroidetes bacterium GWE2_41_25]|nr:MAG: hypothetical protein A2X03_12010 [Bacteroidetes bacterium GWA2_40_15]OFX93634.1 MAG: hypothetical protein A2X06_05500 [Bacteroidetes bacterium GWC2_40_22]OFY01638.1 MAG: hypothetical protein A2X05_18875 [Bacteroidetes bacterium GWE2_41_25]OFY60391.1 MAG: hypothetical protein A2X04_17465 [Bacteroidetes bacterium GWF2_41_9]HAM10893.1 hypothetical protein [Bacteroidales bacterium]
MKKAIIMIVFTLLIAGQNYLNSQSVAFKESLDSINAILKANPYHDGFNDVYFYNSIDITPEKELYVEMSFGGPFKWVYKVKISDLDISLNKDICRESPNSICWVCKQSDSGLPVSCVQAEMIMEDGGSEKENASNICLSFSGRNLICNELNNKLRYLFGRVLNNSM